MPQDPAALELQVATIPLVRGVDTKTDAEVTPVPALQRLENASFFAPGAIGKDDGYSALSMTAISGSQAISGSFRRFIETGKSMLIADSNGVLEYADTPNRLRKLPNAGTGTQPGNRFGSLAIERIDDIAIDNDLDEDGYASATINVSGNVYELFAACNRLGVAAIRVVIREEKSGTILYNDLTQTGDGRTLRATTCGTRLLLIWLNGADVRGMTWDAATPTTAPVFNTNLNPTDNSSGTAIDAVGGASVLYVAYRTTGPDTVTSRRLNPATFVTAGTSTFADTPTQIAMCLDSAENQLITYTAAGGAKMVGFTSAGAARGNSTIDAAGSRVTCVSNENATARGTVFYVNTSLRAVQVSFDAAGGIASGPSSVFSMTPASKPVLIGTSVFICARYSGGSQAEATLCMIACGALNGAIGNLEPVAWALRARALQPDFFNGTTQALHPITVPTANAIEYRFAFGVLDRAETLPGASPSDRDQNLVRCIWRPWEGQAAVPTKSETPYVANSFISSGQGLNDASFGFAPTIIAVVQSAAGGSLAPGSYVWQAVYEQTLFDGTVITSAPSLPFSFTVTGGNNRATVEVSCPFARCVQSGNVKTRLFRSQAGPGATRTIISQFFTTGLNSAATATIIDNNADSAIASNRLIYTTGGVLEAAPAPPHRICVSHQNRLFCVDEETKELRYTRDIVDGEAPAWHPNLAIGTIGEGLIPAALVSTSNGLWLLGRDSKSNSGAIALLTGLGPDDTGAGSTFALQRLESADVGPTHWRAAISTPAGVLFEDPKQGYHLLPSGGGTPSYIGAAIQEKAPLPSDASTTISMHVLQDRKEVRCVVPADIQGSRTLIYHYDVGAWSIRTMNPTAGTPVDATMWGGRHVYLLSDGTVYRHQLRRTGTVYQDGGTFYPLAMGTGWIRMADLAGLQVVWDIYLCGKFHSACGLTVNLYTDGSAVPDTWTFSSADITDNQGDLKLRIKPRRRKMERFRIELIDTDAGSGTREAISWNAIRIHYGALRRGTRQRTTGLKG